MGGAYCLLPENVGGNVSFDEIPDVNDLFAYASGFDRASLVRDFSRLHTALDVEGDNAGKEEYTHENIADAVKESVSWALFGFAQCAFLRYRGRKLLRIRYPDVEWLSKRDFYFRNVGNLKESEYGQWMAFDVAVPDRKKAVPPGSFMANDIFRFVCCERDGGTNDLVSIDGYILQDRQRYSPYMDRVDSLQGCAVWAAVPNWDAKLCSVAYSAIDSAMTIVDPVESGLIFLTHAAESIRQDGM